MSNKSLFNSYKLFEFLNPPVILQKDWIFCMLEMKEVDTSSTSLFNLHSSLIFC